jgi:CcmD family protein
MTVRHLFQHSIATKARSGAPASPLAMLAMFAPLAPASSGGPAAGYSPVGAGPELQGGELLLVLAYAAIWLAAFALIALSLRRQRQLDHRIEQLALDLTRHGDKPEAPAGKRKPAAAEAKPGDERDEG